MLAPAAGLQGGLRVLEWIPSQQLLVRTTKLAWNEAWKTMMAELAPQSKDGDYVRPAPQRGTKTPRLETGQRYELYVGNACPWCHRATVAAALRQVPEVTVTMLEDDAGRASRGGWIVRDPPDRVFGAVDLKGVYDKATRSAYRGRVTAPLLVDARAKTVVASDSADIVRALCAPGLGNDVDLRPAHLVPAIDEACDWVYEKVNNGVYQCGFCTTQQAYERAEAALHDGLARADELLKESRFLVADTVTEADVWLYPTVARFDAVYAPLFRCGRKTVRADYPNLARWASDMARLPGIDATFDRAQAARSYYASLFPLNPSGIVPKIPELDVQRPPLDDHEDLLAAATARFADPPR